ncbi:MAG: acetyl-CoA carboxylase biotin carboxyl carrier protein [Hellea sp.]|nr:acetyl-CoA carboxylase biotin carboxyl carrier protein [Hellea sp.]MDG2362447.1 acetyl-CoA carboxylase biotin carboxyl carrier protein [Hellea sp.]
MTKSNFKPSLQSIKVTRELTKILTENNLSEIQIEEGDIKIKLSRRNHAITDIYQETKDEVNAREVTLNTKNNKLTTESNSDHTSHINAVKSPMVGTVYTRPSPDADPFVKVNDKVKEGDTIVLIEAMKTFNSITATKSGTITKILIENAQPVEFGDPLFTIE